MKDELGGKIMIKFVGFREKLILTKQIMEVKIKKQNPQKSVP